MPNFIMISDFKFLQKSLTMADVREVKPPENGKQYTLTTDNFMSK